MDPLLLAALVVLTIFVAALVRSALGFGDAVIGMPVLALLAGIRTATPLVAFLGPALSILILARARRRVDWPAALRLTAASLAGIPLGIYGLARLPEAPLRVVLGVVVLAYGLFGLLRPTAARPRPGRGGGAWLVGFGAGILGGAYNTNGPPVVVYGTLRGWPPETFRATLQGYFLPTGLAILAGHGLAGFWTREVLTLFAVSLPALVAGVALGARLNRRLSPDAFRAAVFGSLAAMGAVLILRSLS